MEHAPEQHDAALTREQTLRIARLARLEITQAQADLYASQLARVLGHVEQLRGMDLAGVKPLLHPHEQPATPAPDEPEPGLPTAVVMKLAPESHPPFISVPKVLGDSGGSA